VRGRILSIALAIGLVLLALRVLADEGVPLADAVKVESGKCIEGSLLVSRIEMWLKRTTIDRRLRVEVRASKTANDIHFTIFRDEKIVGEKDMRAEMSCAEFQSAVALAIASALDAIILQVEREALDAEPLDASAPETAIDAAPEASPAIIVDAAPPPPPRVESSRVLFTLESGLSATHLPVATVLLTPSIDIRILRWLDARVAFAFTPEISSVLGPMGSRLVTQLVIGEAQGCFVWRGLPVLPRGCVGIAAGAIPAHGILAGLPLTSSANFHVVAPWSALAVRLDARWPVEGLLGVLLSVSVDPVFAPPTFTIDDVKTTMPAVGFSLLGGVQLRVF
jgi:hypothetical protein